MNAGGDKSSDVRHVDEEDGVDSSCDFGNALEIDNPGISAGSSDYHFGFVLVCELFNFVVVDALIFFFHTIGEEFVHAAGKIERMAVGEMAAVREIHAEDDVVLLQDGHVDGDVGRRAGMRLDVGVLGAEEFLGAIDGELLDLIREFAATVIALAGKTFGVLIGEDGAHRFEDSFRDEIFGGDEFETGGLALGFFAEEIGDLGIDGVERTEHAGVGVSGH